MERLSLSGFMKLHVHTVCTVDWYVWTKDELQIVMQLASVFTPVAYSALQLDTRGHHPHHAPNIKYSYRDSIPSPAPL